MSNLHDLLAKLAALEESAKKSDIPAVQRKAQGGDWKVTKKDLDAEEKEGKISHKDNLAKNSGRTDESIEEEATEPVSDVAPQNSEVQGGAGAADESIEECGGEGNVQLSMKDLIALVNHLQGKGAAVHGDEVPLMGDESVGEEFGNAAQGDAGPEVMPVAAVTQTGNDMFSKGQAHPRKVNGGENPMQEALAALYADVKSRQLDELSKGTLASYTKKAAADMNDKAFVAGADFGQKRKGLDNDKKAWKRQHGIEKAVDKMSLKEANAMIRKMRK
jgi:hypothetical protein